ncbi:sporulation integral membrane protein YtvI [Xylanibacillus composti]|nr:sporulation integral membrane protein YtvI [Xylanibacillus composti]
MINKILLRRIIIVLALLVICVFAYIYFSKILPILLALLTAMMFEPLVRWLQRRMKTEKRLLPVTIVFTTFFAICSATLYLTLTRVLKSIYELALKIPHYAVEMQQFIDNLIVSFNKFIDEIPQGHLIIMELENQSKGLTTTAVQMTSQLINWLGMWLQSIPNMLFVTLIYFITFFLISLDLPRLLNVFFNFFEAETSGKLRFVFQRMGKVFLGYWKAQFILSIGVLLITYISLLFISPKAALLMSIIIWVVDIIPLYVGPALVLVPWALLEIIMGNTHTGIQLLILATVLLILRRVIEPKVLGDSIGLAALPTVLSMYFGFVFFGVTGLILGPFVYIAIRSAKESGLFHLNFMKK